MRTLEFPDIKISKQLFHVPGAAVEGGFTAGAVRMMSPEPGGRAVLEIEPSFRCEWGDPWASWLMSKINGHVFHVRLCKTPQIITARDIQRPSFDAYPRDDPEWHAPVLTNDLQTAFVGTALEGTSVLTIDMLPYGAILHPGHVIGHATHSYMVDEVTYDANMRATVVVTPPVRRNVAIGEACLFTPIFTGTIANGSEMRATYDASNAGYVQIGKITLSEAIVL